MYTYRGSELKQPSNLEARDLVLLPALSGEKFRHSSIASNCEELPCELRSVNHQSGFAIVTSISPYILGSHSGGEQIGFYVSCTQLCEGK